MQLSDFYYDLPKELIAQTPLKERSSSRLLTVDKNSGKLTYVSLYGLEEAENKFNYLIKECYVIIEKYHSQIFEEILGKLKNRIGSIK